MDDFLHNLRTNNPKAFDRNRRNFDGNRFKPADRQNQNPNLKDKRKIPSQRPFLGDQLLVLKKAVETMADAAAKQAAALERLVEAEERKAAAIESLIGNLTGITGVAQMKPVPLEMKNSAPNVVSEAERSALSEPSTPAPDRESVDRLELISRIAQLRDSGTSYEKIAQIFDDENVPTLSGRGKWRGQTIFRLSKEAEAEAAQVRSA